jgi:hypothetical protein
MYAIDQPSNERTTHQKLHLKAEVFTYSGTLLLQYGYGPRSQEVTP